MGLKDQLPLLLVASPLLNDPEFRCSVILLIESDESGAFGFVINNKSHMYLRDVVDPGELKIPDGIPVWYAGPVDSSSAFILHNQESASPEEKIAPGISLSTSQDALIKMVHRVGGYDHGVLYPFRMMIGYAGWGPGQLEDECERGFWIPTSLDKDILFNMEYEKIWRYALDLVNSEDCDNASWVQEHHPVKSQNRWLH
ncbi:MAG: YqgE/AlgH family protein [Deltaproteobacteria bacterium]|nr:YqgE/AlgH family protein [Deltaproteobacteria bacterium]